ncbi:uncharacterized protein V1513DRAFT_286356 [Lipomyces chichibuensis]|uniref:uncharacterized protein n=1 Tax=Lipomyces chichibuensis TaxID=1546026 RepID=UPI003343C0C8
MLFVKTIFLASAFYAATIRGTPVASTSYPIPTIITPYNNTWPEYDTGDIHNSKFDVHDVLDFGILKDYNNEYSLDRDGGGSCSLANQTFWFFCDTIVSQYGEFVGFLSNSVALALDYNHAGWLRDISASSTYGVFTAIPYTDGEQALAKDIFNRIAIWTYTNCVPINDTSAVHFWEVVQFIDGGDPVDQGTTMAVYNLDPDKNELSITREDQYAYSGEQYAYGLFANVVVEGIAYLYALDVTYSSRQDVHLACAPVSQITDKSSWKYFDAESGEWSSTQPSPSERNASAAVISNSMPFSSGNIYYSEYHNQYLLIFFNNWIDNTFRVLSAPTPVGPWTTDNKVLYEAPQGKSYNYGAQSTPIYYQTDGGRAGKDLMLAYTYQDVGSKYPKAMKLKFA